MKRRRSRSANIAGETTMVNNVVEADVVKSRAKAASPVRRVRIVTVEKASALQVLMVLDTDLKPDVLAAAMLAGEIEFTR